MSEVSGESSYGAPAMIGASLRRYEDPALLRGQGQYVEDVRLPDMLHMAVIRSPYAHARINGIDLEPARRVPGVVGAFSAADLPEIRGPMGDPSPSGFKAAPRPVLAVDRVRYAGEPIAIVVANDSSIAHDAAEQATVDFTPLEGVGNVLVASRQDAPVLHDWIGSNVAGEVERGFGDIDAAFNG